MRSVVAQFHQTTLLMFLLLLLIATGTVFGILIFARRNNIANILVLLSGIQRYFIDLGFALKPYLIFSFLLFPGIFSLDDLKLRLRRLRHIFQPVSVPFLGLIFSLLVSGLVTGTATKSIRHYILLGWNWAIVGAYCVYVQSAKEIIQAHKLIVKWALVYSVFGVIMYLLYIGGVESIASPRVGTGFLYREHSDIIGRLRGLDTDPNAYGLYSLPLLFHAFGWLLVCKCSDKKAFWPGLVVVFVLVNIIMTFSRGTIISLVAGFAFMSCFVHLGRKATIFLVVIGVLLLGTTCFGTITKISKYIIDAYTYRSSLFDAHGGRLASWTGAIDVWSTNTVSVFFGIGQGRLVEYLDKQAHNAWLELLAENGIIAFTFAVLLFAMVMWKGIGLVRKLLAKSDARGYVLLGAVSGLFAMMVMLGSVSLFTPIYFWFQLGFVLSMIHAFSHNNHPIVYHDLYIASS